MRQALTGADVFDGMRLHHSAVVLVDGARVVEIARKVPDGFAEVSLQGGTLAPGFLDLQVNDGGGQMVSGDTDLAALTQLCAQHGPLGATGVLPTLITDTQQAVRQVLAAGITAVGVPGFLGLHLEGPHLDPRRKGAHDAGLIRAMTDADLALYCDAARALPALMITVAPASVTVEQIAALTAAGVVVSLGHAEASLAEVQAAQAAGAQCATHLFNAMSQLTGREPGLVGAVLSSTLFAGVIADGHHVAVESLKIAMAARPEGLFLVSDCMAVAGTELTEFTLGGRRILRRGGRLTLEDGTLAGADLTLAQAVKLMVEQVGLPLDRALAMATATPARVIGRGDDLGRIAPGRAADMMYLNAELELAGVWRAGKRLP